jgi:hypothetical protein
MGFRDVLRSNKGERTTLSKEPPDPKALSKWQNERDNRSHDVERNEWSPEFNYPDGTPHQLTYADIQQAGETLSEDTTKDRISGCVWS